MSAIQRILTFGAVSVLAAQVAGSVIFKRDGGVVLTPDTTSGVCGDTTCDEATCLVDVGNLYGCTGQYSGFGASGQVAGTCDNLVKGVGGSIPISCPGVSLTFCQKNGKNYVDFRNSGGPSSATCTLNNGEYDCGPFTTGNSLCG